MESQLRRLQLDYSVIAAVDAEALPESSFIEFSDISYQRRHYGRQFLATEVGRALSHQKVYRKLLEAGHSHAVILEEGVVLDRDIARHVAEISRNMSAREPEVVLLGPIDSYYLDGKTLIDQYQLVEVANAIGGTGYVLNARAARLLIQSNFPVRFHPDDWERVRYFTGCHLRGMLPALVGRHTGPNEGWTPGARQVGARLTGASLARSRIAQLPLALSALLRGVFRRRQRVTVTQTRLRRPPLTSVPTPTPVQGNIARD